MAIPPGVAYLFQTVPRLLIPAISVYLVCFLAEYTLNVRFRRTQLFTACTLSLPVTFYLSLVWRDFKDNRRAKALGAAFPATISGSWPGSLDRIIEGAKMRPTMYPGDKIEDYLSSNQNIVNYKLLFANRIITTEPEYIKSILATEFDHFEKGEDLNGIMAPLLGTGVFNSDGEMWRFHRSMTRPFFTKDKISHFQIFDRHAQDAISQMKERVRQGFAIDIQDVVSRFTLDSATEFLFSTDVRSLSAGLNYPPGQEPTNTSVRHPSNVFADAFVNAQETLAQRFNYSTAWPMSEFKGDKIKPDKEVIMAFIDPIVDAALANKKKGANMEEDETLLEHLVALTDDPTIIKDETLNIMIAGKDTTASTLTFVMGMLAEHPHILLRLREEILSQVGPARMPTYDDVREMKYLRAVINETLRLYTPVPFNVRHSVKDTVWPSLTGGKPIFVPANTMCIYSVFLMHRREDLWGPDVLTFDPDRFLDERLKKYLIPNPFIFLPFNAGPRICLGQQFAYNEVSLMVIRLLQAFSEFSLDPEASPASKPPASWAAGKGRKAEEKIWIRSHLTMHAKNGCWMRFKEAANV